MKHESLIIETLAVLSACAAVNMVDVIKTTESSELKSIAEDNLGALSVLTEKFKAIPRQTNN